MKGKTLALRACIALAAVTCCFGIGYLFYKHFIASAVLSVFGFLAVPGFESFLQSRGKQEMVGHFRHFLYAFSTSLAAGKSVENAMAAAEKDLTVLFQSERGRFIQALKRINNQAANGVSADKAFMEFADRSGIADIRNFSEIFVLCKQSGGDLVELIRRSAGIIAEKLEIEQDIHVMTAQKRFESKVMIAAPFAMIALLAFGSPDYMAPLYEGFGRLWMSGVLLLLILSAAWIQRIMKLEV